MAEQKGELCVTLDAGEAADEDCDLPSDDLSLSDSDPEDKVFLNEPEVSDISSKEFPLGVTDTEVNTKNHSIQEDVSTSVEQLPSELFQLKGMSSSFSLRSRNIFDNLESAAKGTTSPLTDDEDTSLFKVPYPKSPLAVHTSDSVTERQGKVPPKPLQSLPDYIEHPERWTKYSLADVSETSDLQNRQVALEFLDSLKKCKDGTLGRESISYSFNQNHGNKSSDKILFKQPVKMQVDGSTTGETLQEKQLKLDSPSKSVSLIHVGKDSPEKVGLEHLVHVDNDSEDGAKRSDTKAVEQPCKNIEVPPHLGFHRIKKSIRKNIRPKSDQEDNSD